MKKEIFTCEDEGDAEERFLPNGWSTVIKPQLIKISIEWMISLICESG